MKNYITAILLSVATAACIGCAWFTKTTIQPDGSTVTMLDSNKIDKAAVLVRGLVLDGSSIAESLDANSVKYLQLASAVLDELIQSKTTSPAAIRKAIASIPVKEFRDPWVKIGVSNAIGAYEIFWQDNISKAINQDYASLTLLNALRDGINSSLITP